MKIPCNFLFSTVLNKPIHITDAYIYSTSYKESEGVNFWTE